MSYQNDDEFTRNLNDRIKELESMSNEFNDQTEQMEGFASKGEGNDTTESLDTTIAPRTEGGTIFFTAVVEDSTPLKLNVTNNSGDIHITSGDVNQVEIKATKEDGDDSTHEDWYFGTVTNGATEVTLRPNWQVSSQLGELASKLKDQLKEGFSTRNWSKKDFTFGMDVRYDLTITVPNNLAPDSRLTIKTANGDIEAINLSAQVDAKTAHGDVKVQRVVDRVTANSANGDVSVADVTGQVGAATANGDISLHGVVGSIESNTANGDVSVTASRGNFGLRSANGDVSVDESEMTGGRVASVAGDISINAALSGGEGYSFDTVSGEVQITVTVPESGATFTARSINGDVSVNEAWTSTGKRAWTLAAGNGPRISAKSVSGDITVNASIDHGLQASDAPTEEFKADTTTDFSEPKRKDDVNINLDMELERAKSWIKDLGTRFGAFMGETESSHKDEDDTAIIDPVESPESAMNHQAAEAPLTPEPPIAPEAPATPPQPATAERRQRLLEAVKNGEMTVDEALAELDKA